MNPPLDVKKKEIVKYLLSQRVLVKPELLLALSKPEMVEQLYAHVLTGTPASIILAQSVQGVIMPAPAQEVADGGQVQMLAPLPSAQPSYLNRVKVLFNYQDKEKKRTPQDFVSYFNARYRAIEKMLQSRSELQNLTSLGRLAAKKDRETVSIIGMIADKQTTKNENIMLVLEDPSGTIKVMVSKSKQDIYDAARDLVEDEVIGITGTTGDKIIFANNIVIPDVPMTGEIKKSPDEVYAAVLSCVHVGSKLFLRDEFERFVRWLRGETGNEQQRELAKKVGYVFIAGDLVDGIGIYPAQEKELSITDIYAQYEEATRLLRQIPEHIALIICPGNHDAGRISEPQKPMSPLYAKSLYSLPNALLLSNPCIVNIHSSEHFPGFDVLAYHGYSFDDYAEIVPSIKNSGKSVSDRTSLIMKFLLQRRHLAPKHSSTLYIPDPEKDPLVIDKIPDIFIGGHIHKSSSATYRGITIVSGSCFQSKTPFQDKMGHEPDPGRVPLINLQTRAVKIMRF
jgi:DNA polymerase II small subunit